MGSLSVWVRATAIGDAANVKAADRPRLITEAPEHVGYLLKERVSDIAVIVDALRRVVEGECVVDPTIVSTLLRRPRDPGPLDRLTSREVDVLSLMAEGRSNGAIAERLVMSPKTVEAHIRQIMQKLDLQESPEDHRQGARRAPPPPPSS